MRATLTRPNIQAAIPCSDTHLHPRHFVSTAITAALQNPRRRTDDQGGRGSRRHVPTAHTITPDADTATEEARRRREEAAATKRIANKMRPSRVAFCKECASRGGRFDKYALRGRDTSSASSMILLGVREVLGCFIQLAAGQTKLQTTTARPPMWRRSNS